MTAIPFKRQLQA